MSTLDLIECLSKAPPKPTDNLPLTDEQQEALEKIGDSVIKQATS